MRLARRVSDALLGLSLGAIIMYGTPAVAATDSTDHLADQPGLVGTMTISDQSDHRMAGSYGLGGSIVTFESELVRESTVAIRVVVNGKPLEATIDVDAARGEWTGHGTILDIEGRTALQGLETSLSAQVRPKLTRAPHEALLYRAIMLWADAPAGLPLTDQTVAAVAGDIGDRAAIGEVAVAGPHAVTECLDPVSGVRSTIACQVDDDNGIAYLPGHVCGGGTALECHDADGHCWTCSVVNAGKPFNCLGRCGGGCCVPDGLGIYTYDCLDHDECCRVHGGCFNPWDAECGDEYFDADDDFWFGTSNCGWSC